MKRRLLILLFTFGTFSGFGSAIASSAYWHGHQAERRQAAFEAHVAEVCVNAASGAASGKSIDGRAPFTPWR